MNLLYYGDNLSVLRFQQHRPVRFALIAAFAYTITIIGSAPVGAQTIAGQSALCGQVVGKTATDRDHALAFCSKGLVDGTVTGVIAMDSLVWFKVSRPMADAFRVDRLSAEQLVKRWMSTWRTITGRKAVTVYVEWQDVEIAKGDTTLVRGDVVTFR